MLKAGCLHLFLAVSAIGICWPVTQVAAQTANPTASMQPAAAISHSESTTTTVTAPGAISNSTAVTTSTVHSTTTTSTTTSTTSTTSTSNSQSSELHGGASQIKNRFRNDAPGARQMARYHWIDRAVEADPTLLASLTAHKSAAMILANHPRLGEIAQYDHYLCRRLTKWKCVARAMARNGECQKVMAYDPEGMYRAIKRDRFLARILAKNPMFDQMITDNPDLGKLISQYI